MDSSCIGTVAKTTEPFMRQVFVTKGESALEEEEFNKKVKIYLWGLGFLSFIDYLI